MASEAKSARAPGIGEITLLLHKMRDGDPKTAEELLSHVYHELHALAVSKVAREAPGQTLQATVLVHEAWLRLTGGHAQHFASQAPSCRPHFEDLEEN